MSISQVWPRLFLSGLDSALNQSILSSRNITLIINASGLEDMSYPQLEGLQVLHVPVQDRPHAPLRQYFDLVAERINGNETGGTLVHCSAGRSRSPALIMAYLMRSPAGSAAAHITSSSSLLSLEDLHMVALDLLTVSHSAFVGLKASASVGLMK